MQEFRGTGGNSIGLRLGAIGTRQMDFAKKKGILIYFFNNLTKVVSFVEIERCIFGKNIDVLVAAKAKMRSNARLEEDKVVIKKGSMEPI